MTIPLMLHVTGTLNENSCAIVAADAHANDNIPCRSCDACQPSNVEDSFFQQHDWEQPREIQHPCSMNGRELCHPRDNADVAGRTHRSEDLHEQRDSACGSLIGAVCSRHVMRRFIGAHARAMRNSTCLGMRAVAAPCGVRAIGGNANLAMMVFFLISAVSYQIWHCQIKHPERAAQASQRREMIRPSPVPALQNHRPRDHPLGGDDVHPVPPFAPQRGEPGQRLRHRNQPRDGTVLVAKIWYAVCIRDPQVSGFGDAHPAPMALAPGRGLCEDQGCAAMSLTGC
jgi:hypothetical protein